MQLTEPVSRLPQLTRLWYVHLSARCNTIVPDWCTEGGEKYGITEYGYSGVPIIVGKVSFSCWEFVSSHVIRGFIIAVLFLLDFSASWNTRATVHRSL